MRFNPFHIFLGLCTAYILFSINIYINPLPIDSNLETYQNKAAEGRLVWQKYNCQACHQLYGLGGYLGPDLTNVYSLRDEGYILAFIGAGINQMPSFNLSENEKDNLISYLKIINGAGTSNPKLFRANSMGMIEKK